MIKITPELMDDMARLLASRYCELCGTSLCTVKLTPDIVLANVRSMQQAGYHHPETWAVERLNTQCLDCILECDSIFEP